VDKSRRGALSGTPRRLVLPYWTEPHGNLSLDVDFATNRLTRDLAVLTPGDVTCSARAERPVLTTLLPLHVLGTEQAVLRFGAAGTTVRADATLTPGDGGAVLTATLPAERLAGRVWQLEAGLPSAKRSDVRFTKLPVALRADGAGVCEAVPEPVASTSKPRPPRRRRSLPHRIARRLLRALGRS
jgi:poly(ribitol-phosphate) beta-N-acetylglucosaminyltransferase